MYLEKDDAYFTTGNIEVKNELKVQGLLYVGGDANVGKLSTETNAKINIQGNLLGTENQDLVVHGCILNMSYRPVCRKYHLSSKQQCYRLQGYLRECKQWSQSILSIR